MWQWREWWDRKIFCFEKAIVQSSVCLLIPLLVVSASNSSLSELIQTQTLTHTLTQTLIQTVTKTVTKTNTLALALLALLLRNRVKYLMDLCPVDRHPSTAARLLVHKWVELSDTFSDTDTDTKYLIHSVVLRRDTRVLHDLQLHSVHWWWPRRPCWVFLSAVWYFFRFSPACSHPPTRHLRRPARVLQALRLHWWWPCRPAEAASEVNQSHRHAVRIHCSPFKFKVQKNWFRMTMVTMMMMMMMTGMMMMTVIYIW